MPDVKIYIRAEDVDKWQAVENKSEFIHNALNPNYGYKDVPKPTEDRVVDDLKGTAAFVPRPPDPETGYPCCTKAKPCKHWTFDGAEGLWRNELTGKTREVIQ